MKTWTILNTRCLILKSGRKIKILSKQTGERHQSLFRRVRRFGSEGKVEKCTATKGTVLHTLGGGRSCDLGFIGPTLQLAALRRLKGITIYSHRFHYCTPHIVVNGEQCAAGSIFYRHTYLCKYYVDIEISVIQCLRPKHCQVSKWPCQYCCPHPWEDPLNEPVANPWKYSQSPFCWKNGLSFARQPVWSLLNNVGCCGWDEDLFVDKSESFSQLFATLWLEVGGLAPLSSEPGPVQKLSNRYWLRSLPSFLSCSMATGSSALDLISNLLA